jgi:hypothetical protein
MPCSINVAEEVHPAATVRVLPRCSDDVKTGRRSREVIGFTTNLDTP